MASDQQVIALRKKISIYHNLSEKEQMSFLLDLGHYFDTELPINLDEPLIIDTVGLLNNMYNSFQEQVYLSSVKDSIKKLTSLCSAMGREIKTSSDRSEKFYERAKNLGTALELLARSMPYAKK